MNDSGLNDLQGGRRVGQGGPPLAVLGAVVLALTVAGVVLSALLGGVLPSPFDSAPSILRYFATQPDAVKASGVLTFAASVPLAIYAATASARLRQLGVTAPGATIALAGGILSSGTLGLSGLLQWTLSRSGIAADGPLVRALHDLAFLTGGVAHLVGLGLLIAGIAVPGLILGLLPRRLAYVGLAIAGVAELSTLVLVWPGLAVVLPIARFPGLVWLVAAGVVLPHRRPRRAQSREPQSPVSAPAS